MDIGIDLLAILFCVGFVASFIDAIAGGGGKLADNAPPIACNLLVPNAIAGGIPVTSNGFS